MYKAKVFFLIIIIVMASIGGLYMYDRIGKFEAHIWDQSTIFSEDDYIQLKSDRDSYKIMQITDLHFALIFSANNAKTYRMLDTMISQESPDLVVVTGDLTIGLFNRTMLRNFASFMEKKHQYWMYVLGNHDYEYGSGAYRYLSVLEEYDYCLFDVGYTNLGYGNCSAVIFNNNNEAIHTLTLLDTSRYETTEAQAKWYKWSIQNLNSVYGAIDNTIFLHIPLNIVKEQELSINENINSLKREPLLYDYIKELGQTKYIAFGHDHLNSYMIDIQGTKYINCPATGFSGYGRVDIAKGVMIYNISKDVVDISFKTQYDYGVK